MSWREFDPHTYLFRAGLEMRGPARLRTNETCFMRRQHRCEKVFGASKSCFVACPTDDALAPLLALLEAKLAAHGVEAVVAVKERAYGQDIVCTKICGRIIESRFCVAILDEMDQNGVSVANPNVYYEYGLMTALRKHVIPFQREGMALAFNIQSQDTIKYSPRNMADEIERAIRDAIAVTEPGQQPDDVDRLMSSRWIRRRLELAGYAPSERDEIIKKKSEDTQFITFTSGANGYLFLAKIDDDKDVNSYLDDLPVLVYRLEELRKQTETKLAELPGRIENTRKQLADAAEDKPFRSRVFDIERELVTLEKMGPVFELRLRGLASAQLGFIASFEIDCKKLRDETESALARTSITAVWNEGTTLRIGDMAIDLGRGPAATASTSDQCSP